MTLHFVSSGPVATVTIDRPASMNALDAATKRRLADAIRRFDDDDSLRAAIVIGAGGRAFSAGADIREVHEDVQRGERPAVLPQPERFPTPYQEFYECRKPLIAAVDGYCLAGGLELALLCDIRVATANSTFGMPEPRRSLIGGTGLIQLPSLIPHGEAMRIQLCGGSIGASRAFDIGLVQALADDREGLLEVADRLAGEIARCAPLAVRAIKQATRAATDRSGQDTWALCCDLQEQVMDTDDFREGVRAFADKRAPVWRSR